MNRTFSVKTLGCKLNQYESSQIANQFVQRGWSVRPFGEEVDIVIINTCTVTDKSDKKCRNYIRHGARLSKIGKAIVTGCMADMDCNIVKEIPEVAAVFRNKEKNKIYDGVVKVIDDYNFPIDVHDDNIKDVSASDLPLPLFRTRGFVKIQDGCDSRCSYCIVPDVRGAPVSRNFSEIIEHAEKLISAGCPEIVLTGITIGKYQFEGKDLSDLIKRLLDLPGEYRIRITSIEPNHVNEKLMEIYNYEKICRHIHLPLQSGSPEILKKMNRPYSLHDYMNVVEKIKKVNPLIAIGTDVIIGFPGEEEKHFMESLKVIESAGFSYVHQFTFSSRTGTPAALMKNSTSKEEVSSRSKGMRELSASVRLKYRKKFEGMTLFSVIEKNKKSNTYTAVTDNYLKIKLENDSLINHNCKKLRDVRLVKAGENENFGILI